MRRYRPKRGWGRCPVCHRTIGATRGKRACRHGHIGGAPACTGTGQVLDGWTDAARWERKPLRLTVVLSL